MTIKKILENEGAVLPAKPKEVKINISGEEIVLYANPLSILETQYIGIESSGKGMNSLVLLVSKCITDKEGNKFSYEDVLKLDDKVAEPLLKAALDVNGRLDPEKK